MTMEAAKWTCTACYRTWEGVWIGGAGIMASECPVCGGTGISGKRFIRPMGTLSIRSEKKLQ